MNAESLRSPGVLLSRTGKMTKSYGKGCNFCITVIPSLYHTNHLANGWMKDKEFVSLVYFVFDIN